MIPKQARRRNAALSTSIVVAALVMLSLLSGCSSLSVSHDFDPLSNFLAYRSFALLERPTANPNNLLHRNPLAIRRLEEAIVERMTLNGFNHSGNGTADLLVAYHGGISERVNVQRWGYSYGPRPWEGSERIADRVYPQDYLIIDVIDSRSMQLVWRGWASGVISTPESTREKIARAADRILQGFPPEKK